MRYFDSKPAVVESERVVNGRTIERLVPHNKQPGGPDVFYWHERVPAPADSYEPVGHRGWSASGDYGGRFHRAIASARVSCVKPADPEADELSRELRRLTDAGFKLVAAMLQETAEAKRKAKPKPPGPFEGGDLLAAVEGLRLLAISPEEIDLLLGRHVEGDAGLYGSDWAKIEPTDDMVWCPPLFDIATQNRIALTAGFGLVRSRYSIYDPGRDLPKAEDQHLAVQPRRRQPGEWIEFVTLLVPGRPNATLLHTPVDHVRI